MAVKDHKKDLDLHEDKGEKKSVDHIWKMSMGL
jgi:hypothetical protein